MPIDGVRVRCPLGGYAPCLDDMCHSGGETLCRLEPGVDFCEHEFDPETCPECWAEDHDQADDDVTSFDEDGRPI